MRMGTTPRGGHDRLRPGAAVRGARGAPTVVVDGAAGRVLGQLDEHGELVPLDEPAADDPSSWPRSWWAHITELPR